MRDDPMRSWIQGRQPGGPITDREAAEARWLTPEGGYAVSLAMTRGAVAAEHPDRLFMDRVLRALCVARIFDLPGGHVHRLGLEATDAVAYGLFGDPPEVLGPAQADAVLEGLSAASRRLPDTLPARPFDTMFISYGPHERHSPAAAGVVVPAELAHEVQAGAPCWLVGHLVTDAWIAAFHAVLGDNANQLVTECWSVERGWNRPHVALGFPWALVGILRWLFQHRAFVDASFGSKRRQRRAIPAPRRPRGWTPRPFYRVQMDDRLVRCRPDTGRQGAARGEQEHACDVRRHERVRVLRGPLPLDPKSARQLRRRGYVVTVTGRLPRWVRKRLRKRRAMSPAAKWAEPRPGEWTAVLVSRVDAHVRRPDLPYRPAVRYSAKLARGDGPTLAEVSGDQP